MAHKPKIKRINLTTQREYLRKLFPNSEISIKRDFLKWKANITPSPMSQTYAVQLEYKLKKSPNVYVIHPKLFVPKGKKLPHIYPKEQLCLFRPRIGAWKGDMLLSKIIVPWISEWLLNYEIWLASGVWCGGGIHPSKKIKKDDEDSI